ncbi:MAG: AAA family ATPase [Acidobacteriaceae bacterium]|nr:AAA family ATPase [Acidobacteriaceae bacterium]
MSTFMRDTESLSMSALSLVLIGPDEQRRRAVARALAGPQARIAREIEAYPDLDDLTGIIEADYDVVMVDLDPNPEQALDVVESLCGQHSSATVMVYSARADAELLVRCMRAGAREFLTEPVLPTAAAEALVRASVRREEVRRHRRATGKLLVFVGAKGGSGVTTVAANFAVALAQQCGRKAALLDLDVQLGDAALSLGLPTKFNVLDALENPNRLDSDFLSVLMSKHASGLAVLGAPDTIPSLQPPKNGMEKLLRVVREDFEHVVVDAGSHSIEMYEALFEAASTVYLVSQVAVADLRNSNRFISRYFNRSGSDKLEVVLNRYVQRDMEIDDAAITKALTRPAKWKIPNDYAAARKAQNLGVPLVSEKSQIARAFAEMARAASGQSAAAEKRKKFGLFK